MNLANKYLFNLQQNSAKKTMSIEEVQKIRERIRVLQNKKVPNALGTLMSNNIRNKDMANLNINVDNINPTVASAIMPHIERNANRIAIATTDVDRVEDLVREGKIEEAKSILSNVKSVAKIINERIMETESYLISMEV